MARAERTLVVAADGSGQYRTVQAAADAAAKETEPVVIRVRPGVYRGYVAFPQGGPPRITLRGDGPGAAAQTVLTLDRSARTPGPDGKPVGTTGSCSVRIDADDFTAEDVTFENSAGKTAGQAVAVRVGGDRCVFRRCRFLGWQDTLYATGNGRQYYRECYIEGSVDFVFGYAAAVFEKCELRSKSPGAVTAQARTEPTQPGGYVFRDCDLTADPSVPAHSVILGRPWRAYARVVFLACRMGSHIRLTGWHNWDDTSREATAFYGEADCTGPGADRSARVPWSRALTPAEIAPFDTRRFLAGADGWDAKASSQSAETASGL
jgi:pectinesterase